MCKPFFPRYRAPALLRLNRPPQSLHWIPSFLPLCCVLEVEEGRYHRHFCQHGSFHLEARDRRGGRSLYRTFIYATYSVPPPARFTVRWRCVILVRVAVHIRR